MLALLVCRRGPCLVNLHQVVARQIRKEVMRLTASLLALCLTSAQAWAQLDPSSVLLLRKGGKAPEKSQLDGGRYKVVEPKRPASNPMSESIRKTVPTAPPVATPPPVVVVPAPSPEPEAPPVVVAPAPPPLTEKVKEMVMGGSEESIETFRDQLHSDDIRQNLMEIEIAPAFLYTESSSNYWFRSFAVASPAFAVAAQIWVTPFFGIRSSFLNSMDSSIYEDSGTRDRTAAEQQWFDAGFRWRKFYGLSRKATTLSLGLDFSEYQFRVGKSVTERNSLKTVGAKLSLEATMPRSTSFAWVTGASITPRADHKEKGAIRSGARDETTVMGIWVGGNHTFDRNSVVFWKLQHSIERNLFEKDASVADPVTGQTPKGVSVTNGTTMFTFGFRWGH